ncbi:MAG: helix-turn-helix transcriptional regulator [Oscillospiraceae bacterium]|jgi:transcriptional regulator with XRE-family HTH domain|nr:helix-turn-helix transcriptional regulator [Oscillospiraceae bacterium]
MKSEFATRLAKLRREKGLSQRQASAKLGLSQALLSHYENDAREPKLDFVVKICDFYGVTSDYILGRTNEKKGGITKLANEINSITDKWIELKISESALIEKIIKITTLE